MVGTRPGRHAPRHLREDQTRCRRLRGEQSDDKSSLSRFSFFVSDAHPLNSCSQNRQIIHPRLFSSFETCLSRLKFPEIFSFQYSTLEDGIRQCLEHPCQKQPSMNTAILFFGKTKSGLPTMGQWRRQPTIDDDLRSVTKRCSVDLFPEDLTAAIIRERVLVLPFRFFTISVHAYA